MFANWIQYIRRIIHHDQVRFIPGIQGLLNIKKWIIVIYHINRLKMNWFRKFISKIQHPFVIKSLLKLGIEGNTLSIMKSVYRRPTVNIVLNHEQLGAVLLRRPGESVLSHHLSSVLYWASQLAQWEREWHRNIQIGKEEVKLCADDNVVYIDNPKNLSNNKCLRICKWDERGHRIQNKHTQINLLLYAINEHVNTNLKI